MKVLFVAGFGPIVRDMEASLCFYRETIGLPLTFRSGRSPRRPNRASVTASGRPTLRR